MPKEFILSIQNTGNLKPWIIPQRGQSYINNYYVNSINKRISLNLSFELFKEHDFDQILSEIEKIKKYKIILVFCSWNQILNLNQKNRNNFIKRFKNYEIHFSLEREYGKGESFLKHLILKNKYFKSENVIKINKKFNYNSLFKAYKKKII